ncbi:hypothetical protein [Dictyobacter formicarum]|uniref:Tc1-like transposase DDE domain-containing protein n=1 Tax=Dictyobacter formicarum TaxID=2778368 RepID=A0ABQ3VE23_9CHLR|nr:hypothetical protein [Dictyobacter formicarum]GHO83961.1 hypothetical protein KSZ_19670 [Dictyobacter formicarum]
MVQDNSFIHFHPDVLVALEPQESPFPFKRAKHWPTEPSLRALKKWRERKLPIQLVTLPTSASWCNPIEKLWRKAKQEKLHLHCLANALKTLRQEMIATLSSLPTGPLTCSATPVCILPINLSMFMYQFGPAGAAADHRSALERARR